MDIVHGVEPQKILELRQAVESKDMYIALKRVFDFSAAFFLIILFLPFLAAIYLIIKFTSPGPAIFRQTRIGMYGKEFTMYKFRSMYVAENNDLSKFVSENERKKGFYIKSDADPRVTPFGRYIRRTSIDELPQLFNVLKGDMSLVGPRPVIRYFLSAYPHILEMRTVVKPGMTGLWQIKNRAHSATILDMLDYDLDYIDNLSLYMDIKILLQTIPSVLKCEGAV
ncbi:MAG: sugar transferase [Candidatus Kapabacteria bacterium]|nr:sugar transferase [Ignavibacteriota bacterium]MCW5883862.1 sugar transferase [Candidatus Kapabacteria bacterium]